MKTTVDIPDGMLEEAMKFSGAKTKREALVAAVAQFNQLRRLAEINARVRGQFRDLMTQEELQAMREADTPKI